MKVLALVLGLVFAGCAAECEGPNLVRRCGEPYTVLQMIPIGSGSSQSFVPIITTHQDCECLWTFVPGGVR